MCWPACWPRNCARSWASPCWSRQGRGGRQHRRRRSGARGRRRRDAHDGHARSAGGEPVSLSQAGLQRRKGFSAINNVAFVANVLMASAQSGIRALRELIDRAGPSRAASPTAARGVGSTSHLAGELLKAAAGIDLTHVPYKGVAPAMNDLLGGQIDLMFDNLPTALAHIQSGKVTALGVSSPTPTTALPDVPAIASRLPGYEIESWFGIVGPASLPPKEVARLEGAIGQALQRPALRQRIEALGARGRRGQPGLCGLHRGRAAQVQAAHRQRQHPDGVNMTQRKRLAVARFWYEGNAFACSRPAARISSAANGSAARRAWTPRAARPPSWRLSRISRTAARTGRSALRVAPRPSRPAPCRSRFPGIRGRGAGRFTRPALGRHLPEPAWRLHHRRGRQSGINLLRAIRAEHPRVPIGASFDLHANIPPALPPLLSCSASYRTYPHIDMRETARAAWSG